MATTRLRSWLGGTATAGAGCLVIGEVAQAHDGSLGTAHAFIDAIATRRRRRRQVPDPHRRRREHRRPSRGACASARRTRRRYDYWKRMEFTEEQWLGLRRARRRPGSLFLSSPFSTEAVETAAARRRCPAWKVASGEIATDAHARLRMADTGLPVLVSTGHERLAEIDDVVRRAARDAARASPCCSARPRIRARRSGSASTCCRVFRNAVRVPGRACPTTPARSIRGSPRRRSGAERDRGARHAQPRQFRSGRRPRRSRPASSPRWSTACASSSG